MCYDKSLKFLKELNKYKLIKRKTHNLNSEFESDSDHSWHLTMLILTFKEELMDKGYNFEKLLEFTLIHDLPEIYTGDFHPYGEAPKNKDELERKSFERLYSILDVGKERRFLKTQNEYEKLTSKEAKLVKALDKLMPLITEITSYKNNESSAFKDLKVTSRMANDYISKFCLDDFSKKLFEMLFNEAKNTNIFYKEK